MGNHADKKHFAEVFNKKRQEKLKLEEEERLDRIKNPNKYRVSKKALNRARLWAAIAATSV